VPPATASLHDGRPLASTAPHQARSNPIGITTASTRSVRTDHLDGIADLEPGEQVVRPLPWWDGFAGSFSGHEPNGPEPMGVHVPLQRPLTCDDADFQSEASDGHRLPPLLEDRPSGRFSHFVGAVWVSCGVIGR